MALLGATTDMNEARSLSYRRDIVDIYSNSWGPVDGGLYVKGLGPLTEKTLENGVKKVCSDSLSNISTTILVIHKGDYVQPLLG